MNKYVAAALGSVALTSLFGYLVMAWCINAVGEAVSGMGDIEGDFDDYDWGCPDVVCVDGVDGLTPDMLRYKTIIDPPYVAKQWEALLGANAAQALDKVHADRVQLTNNIVDLLAYRQKRGS